MIDKALKKQCYEKAIKKVASSNKTTQKAVRETLNKKYNLCNDMLPIKHAVQNWTVHFYHEAIQAKYL